MQRNSKPIASSAIFSGWKEIANYLGKGVRTIQRYESQMGLPVRRPAGRSRAAVLATKAELDAWVSASPIREMYSIKYIRNDAGNRNPDKGINAGLKQMHALRSEMLELRHELTSSLHSLSKNLEDVCSFLNKSRRIDDLNFSSPVRGLLGDTSTDIPLENIFHNALDNDRNSTLVAFRRKKAS